MVPTVKAAALKFANPRNSFLETEFVQRTVGALTGACHRGSEGQNTVLEERSKVLPVAKLPSAARTSAKCRYTASRARLPMQTN